MVMVMVVTYSDGIQLLDFILPLLVGLLFTRYLDGRFAPIYQLAYCGVVFVR